MDTSIQMKNPVAGGTDNGKRNLTENTGNIRTNSSNSNISLKDIRENIAALDVARYFRPDSVHQVNNDEWRGPAFWRGGNNPQSVAYSTMKGTFCDHGDSDRGGSSIDLMMTMRPGLSPVGAAEELAKLFPERLTRMPAREVAAAPVSKKTDMPQPITPPITPPPVTPPPITPPTGEENRGKVVECFCGLPIGDVPSNDSGNSIRLNGKLCDRNSRKDYAYFNADGTLAMVKTKYYCCDAQGTPEVDSQGVRAKTFICHYPVTPNVRNVPQMFSRADWTARRPEGFNQPIYNLLEVNARPSSEVVYLTEGESDAEALQALGFCASCHKSSGRMDYSALSGRKVVLIGDNEESGTGRRLLEKSKALIEEAGAEILAVTMPPRPDGVSKEDVRSWIERQKAAGISTEGIKDGFVEWSNDSKAMQPENTERQSQKPMNLLEILDQFPPNAPDPNEIITSRFFCKGNPMLIIGPTSAGKSAFVMQLALSLACGVPFMGLCPAQGKRFRTLIVQAENDGRDLADAITGIIPTLAECHGIAEEFIKENAINVDVLTILDQTGTLFLVQLDRYLAERQETDEGYDIVALDPLLSYFAADMNNQEKVSEFTRGGLQGLIKRFNIALILIHHTGKVREGAKETLVDNYNYFGSSDLVNWVRSSLLIEPIPGVDADGRSCFRLKAGKHGHRLHWEGNCRYMRFGPPDRIGFEERAETQMPTQQYGNSSGARAACRLNSADIDTVTALLRDSGEARMSYTAFLARVEAQTEWGRKHALNVINTAISQGVITKCPTTPETIRVFNMDSRAKFEVHLPGDDLPGDEMKIMPP